MPVGLAHCGTEMLSLVALRTLADARALARIAWTGYFSRRIPGAYYGVCSQTDKLTCPAPDARSAAEAIRGSFFTLNGATRWSRTGIAL